MAFGEILLLHGFKVDLLQVETTDLGFGNTSLVPIVPAGTPQPAAILGSVRERDVTQRNVCG